MSQIQTLILGIGAFQGFALFTLLVSDKRVNYASKLLGIQCLFISTTFALPLIVLAGDTIFAWLIGFLVFLPACYGALTYLYCRTAITGLALKTSDMLHFLPLVVCYLLNYDILLSAEKALFFVTTPNKAPLFRHTLTVIIFYGQIVVYTVFLISMVIRYQTKAKQTLSSYNPDIFKWLWALIGFVISIWALKIVFYFIQSAHKLNTLADSLLVLMVYFIAIIQWRNPSLFHIQQLTTQLVQATVSNSPQPVDSDNQPSDGLLDQDTRARILQSVQEQVKEQNLYRNSELTLATLAEQVGVGVHHLSETINQYGGKNFNRLPRCVSILKTKVIGS